MGSASPISYEELAKYEGLCQYQLDIYDAKGKVAGTIKLTSLLKWQPYTPPTPSEFLDSKSYLLVLIKDASFFEDVDAFGDQDPFIKFKYGDKTYQTEVKEDAGKNASWFETFVLFNVDKLAVKNTEIVFEAFDKEVVSKDKCIGFSDRIDLPDIVSDGKPIAFALELYNESGKLAGSLSVQTQLVVEEPKPYHP